jgi:hypothetical protein
MHGKMLVFKSTQHRDKHFEAFPQLREMRTLVIPATHTAEELDMILAIRTEGELSGWAVYKSSTWIKGYEDAIKYCEKNGLTPVELSGLKTVEFLKRLSKCEGLVFLPRGVESCSRIAIEARLLGLDYRFNDNVSVSKEKWFQDLSIEGIVEYLKGQPKVFWNEVGSLINENTACPA